MNKILVALAIVCACVCAKKCHVTVQESNGQNYTYDLSQIGEVSVTEEMKYTMNLCDGVSSGCPSTSAVCMTDEVRNTHVSLGLLSTRAAVAIGGEEPGQGAVVLFGQGDHCTAGYYTSTVLVLCDPAQDPPIVTVLPDSCDFSFQIVTKYGCGRPQTSSDENDSDDSEESDAGEIVALVILIVLICGFAAYFAIGAIISKRQGNGLLIHQEFWCALPFLVVDGVKFIGHGCRKGDYTAV